MRAVALDLCVRGSLGLVCTRSSWTCGCGSLGLACTRQSGRQNRNEVPLILRPVPSRRPPNAFARSCLRSPAATATVPQFSAGPGAWAARTRLRLEARTARQADVARTTQNRNWRNRDLNQNRAEPNRNGTGTEPNRNGIEPEPSGTGASRPEIPKCASVAPPAKILPKSGQNTVKNRQKSSKINKNRKKMLKIAAVTLNLCARGSP